MITYQSLLVPMTPEFLEQNPGSKHQLAQLYIDTWSPDPNFREFFICPKCNRYFGFEDVLAMRPPVRCPNDDSRLDRAWKFDGVINDIDGAFNEPGFFGQLVVTPCVDTESSACIVGFAWSFTRTMKEIQQKFGQDALDILLARYPDITDPLVYFSEIGLDPRYRGLKLSGSDMTIGRNLAVAVSQNMVEKYPNQLSLLRTHQNSAAFRIYRSLGYQYLQRDPVYDAGRVLMTIYPCSSFKLD